VDLATPLVGGLLFVCLIRSSLYSNSHLENCLSRDQPNIYTIPNSGFPRSIESIEQVLNFKISFQDLEKVLNLAKMYIMID